MNKRVEWLGNILRSGYAECNWVREAATKMGFTKSELRAARKYLGAKTWHQVDNRENPGIENWFWYLPEDEG